MRHPLRLSDDVWTGCQAVFLTLCTLNRQRHFRTLRKVEIVREIFFECCDEFAFEIPAYCFMPDHFHALISGYCENGHARRLVRVFKQRSAYHFRRASGQQLWQRSYFDRTLRSEDAVLPVCSYIAANPVRAGLVGSAAEYPFWGSQIYTRTQILESIAAGQCRPV